MAGFVLPFDWQNKPCYFYLKTVYKRPRNQYNVLRRNGRRRKTFAIKATWGISKIVFSLVLLPICLVGLVLKGLITIALPLLAIIGLVVLIKLAD